MQTKVKKQVNNSIKGLCCLSVWARVAGISYRGQPCGLCWFSVGKSAMGPMTMGLGFSLGWHISVARRIHGVTGPGWARGGGGQPLTRLGGAAANQPVACGFCEESSSRQQFAFAFILAGRLRQEK